MDETHLGRAVLERFFLLEADAEETRRVFRHLVAGCEVCRQLASKVMSEVYLSDEIYPIPQGEEIMGQHDLCDEEGRCEISLEQELDLNRSVAGMLEHMERSRRESEAAEGQRLRLLRANPKQLSGVSEAPRTNRGSKIPFEGPLAVGQDREATSTTSPKFVPGFG